MNLLRKPPLLLLLLIAGFASCKRAAVTPNQNKGKNLVLSALQQQKVTADNAFTLKLFKNLDSANTGGANLFVSPLSVSFALGMTSNGANGATLTAFKNTLDFAGLTQAQVNDYYNNLITNLPELDPNTTLNIANSIWYRQGFSVLPQFLQTDSSYFHAQAQSLDFTNPSAPGTINNWVNTETHGKIPSIITTIPSNAVMYLVNAMYFKSTWKEKFDPAQTQTQPFYLADNSQVQASFMTGNLDFNYYNDNTVYVYELPYSNNKYSMVIVMPVNGGAVKDVVAGCDPVKWQTWMSGLVSIHNTITLPKFKFSYSVTLNNALTNLGLGIAFTDIADFSLINATVPLKISEVKHKAFVETDESGTTAAAATSVGIVVATAPAPMPPINHPFMFAIREMSSGLIVFAGTVNNPLLTGN
ncbi:MAG: serpin family protein [Sphingobacteriales bacterium]